MMLLKNCLFSLVLIISSCVNSQNKQKNSRNIGGPCEGCEAIYEYGEKILSPVDTLPGFTDAAEKIKISGIIYEKDNKTPAKDIIVYAYQTNEKGVYPKSEKSTGWEKRHGFIRGWIKTDVTGTYTFYTFRPASYPNSSIEQHIHLTIKEPGKNAYYIDDINFEDDPFIRNKVKKNTAPRGGGGIVKLKKRGELFEGTRDIILGLNIPYYY